MDEQHIEKPARKTRSDKGKPRPRQAVAATPLVAAPEPEAPIHVRLRLKNYSEPVEFGCAEHTVENGFHVFMYPSERDRFRTTRREFAISEIIEIEITEARHHYALTIERPSVVTEKAPPAGPRIFSARKAGIEMMQALETASGSIKMETPPGISFGDSVE